jgi:hypothetical protein
MEKTMVIEGIEGVRGTYDSLAKLWRRAAETLIVDKALTMVDPTDDVDKINEPVFRYMSEKDIECYKSMITENHRQGEIKLSREQLRQLLNIAYSPSKTDAQRLFEARVGQSVITDIERNLAFFDRDVKSVQADVTKIELMKRELISRGFEVEEAEVDAEMKSSGEWALNCSKSNRTSKLEYSHLDIIIDDVVIHAAFYVPGNNLKDLERHIDGMCVGTTNEPDEEDENDYIDPDQDSDSDSE